MRYSQLLDTDSLVVADLVQNKTGWRGISFRKPQETKDPHTVLSTRPYPGRLLRKAFYKDFRSLKQVYLESGEQFQLDGHMSWMTSKEVEYFMENMKGSLETPGPPWVNGLPPLMRDK